ncbi:MAG: hypothetical protein J5I98_05960 [Phaeodactylibacter sp.]|nr:hypothetical protein [Phaeodactylibacter sp.]
MVELLYLTHDEIIRCKALEFENIIRKLEQVFDCHYRKDFVLPHKSVIRWGDAMSETSTGRINSMPAYVGGNIRALGIKWIGGFPANRNKGLPRATALIVLNDPDTGLPQCIMEGAYISAMRTVGTNLLAARYLCKKDSRKLGVVGAGVQIRFHVKGFLNAFKNIETVYAFNRTRRNGLKMKEMMNGASAEICLVDSIKEAVEDVDILISGTTSNAPLITTEKIKPGTTYFHFSGNECTYEFLNQFTYMFVDDWEAIRHRNNLTPALMHQEGKFNMGLIKGNLGELVAEKVSGRSREENIIFCAMGIGISDVAIAKSVYDEARDRGLGRKMPLWENLNPLFTD